MKAKASVTDGQLGQLALKQHELFRRAKEGTYDNFDEVLAGLQTLIEGKEPTAPTLVVEPKFAAWRTFLIGGVGKKALLARVESGFSVGDWAKDMVKQKAFTTQDAEEEINTIILTPADFGYERNPTTAELLDPTRLAEWSRQNAHRLPEGCVVELLPAEAGPHIRDQYKDQPKGEILWIAMERITDSGGCPNVFYVGRGGDGEQGLGGGHALPTSRWLLGHRIVFCLRKVA
jgi:hypothetical protein